MSSSEKPRISAIIAARNAASTLPRCLDALVAQAKEATDIRTRKNLYARVRQIMYDEVPFIFVHYETLNYLMSEPGAVTVAAQPA